MRDLIVLPLSVSVDALWIERALWIEHAQWVLTWLLSMIEHALRLGLRKLSVSSPKDGTNSIYTSPGLSTLWVAELGTDHLSS
jgi:hypothetical protein